MRETSPSFCCLELVRMAEWSVEHWGVLGTWFSGMATTAIGALALYLAHPSRPLRLKVQIYKMKVARDNEVVDTPYWRIAISNRGKQAVTIVAEDWWIGRTKTSFTIHVRTPSSRHIERPVHVFPGQTLFLEFHHETLFNETWHLCEKHLATLRFRLHTSEKTRKFHLGDELIQAIRTTPSARRDLRELLES